MASISKRGEHSYQLTASCGYAPDGKKVTKKKTIKVDPNLTAKQLKKELEKQKVLFQKEVEDGNFLDSGKITFGEYTEKWFNDYARRNLSPTVLPSYESRLRLRIIPHLGYIKLSKLQPHHINEFYDIIAEEGERLDMYYAPKDYVKNKLSELSAGTVKREIGITDKTFSRLKNGERTNHATAVKICEYFKLDINKEFSQEGKASTLSSRTIKHHHDIISAILSEAVKENLILNNPILRVRVPKVKKKQIPFLDDEQIITLFSALESEPLKYKAVVYTAIDTGVRVGELMGLEWRHIDFEKGTLKVEQQKQNLTPKYGGEQILSPKTDSGNRLITLTPTAVKLLKEYRTEQFKNRLLLGSEWVESDFVFRHEDGTPMRATRPYQWLRAFLEKIGLPHIPFHGLRHTNASLLISAGEDIVTVSGRLGHSDKNVTLNTYSHIIKSKEQQAANRMERFYQKSGLQK